MYAGTTSGGSLSQAKTVVSIFFTPDGSEEIVEGVGSALSAFNSKSGKAVALTEQHQTAFDRLQTRYEKDWFVTAENEEGGEEEAGHGLAIVR
jgi:hypothetical protein